MSSPLTSRWLDREATADYLSLRVDELPRLLRRGLLPQPSYHFGPRSPRWDREALDELFGASIASRRTTDIDARIAALARNPPRGRQSRSSPSGRHD